MYPLVPFIIWLGIQNLGNFGNANKKKWKMDKSEGDDDVEEIVWWRGMGNPDSMMYYCTCMCRARRVKSEWISGSPGEYFWNRLNICSSHWKNKKRLRKHVLQYVNMYFNPEICTVKRCLQSRIHNFGGKGRVNQFKKCVKS